MEQIVEQLIKINTKDWLDIVGILLPILLTIVIIVQNKIHSHRTDELEKKIYNRDQINRYHGYILDIYNTYNDFCDIIFSSGFDDNVKSGNVNLANSWVNNLINMRISIGRKLDLAKLIFGQSNKELYSIIEERFKLAMEIISKYLEYINSGKLLDVSENAWTRIIPQNSTIMTFRYNYVWLAQNKTLYDDFMKLCQSEELQEIQALIRDYREKHNYDNYDKYFEEFFSLDKF